MDRKKKLRLIQLSLLIGGALIIIFTYSIEDKPLNEKIFTEEKQKKIQQTIDSQSNAGDIFFNIEYSGLDLSGNRYILKSKEAFSNKSNAQIVNMKDVEAIFYFKDDTVLYVRSDNGIYNNKTLDMNFDKNVKAEYEDSKLSANKAEYSNSKGFLTIIEKVVVEDIRGTMFADKLFFDIKKQSLNISSFTDGKINANVNLK
tara:strand:+ start:1595 stop:2197 length:603 start_codon:yes stop_codon:yes gene_type:complete